MGRKGGKGEVRPLAWTSGTNFADPLALENVISRRISMVTAWAFGDIGGVKDWEMELAFDAAGEDPWG